MNWNYANQNHSTIEHMSPDGVPWLTFPKLSAAGVRHGFSTRAGGVSEGFLGTMNLSFTRGDDPARVRENFRRIAGAIGFSADDLVFSTQIHGTKLRRVGAENRGEGICRESVPGIDGLATNEPGVPLYTSYADCVPLLFYDEKEKVIAMAHSGWRGTAARIGAKMLAFLSEEFGTRPEHVIAAIGPSICRDCYEVSEDVAEAFRAAFLEREIPEILDAKGGGKYRLDLWRANEIILTQAGILPEHLDVTDLCTCCNHELLFSHRASGGKRGNLGCFMVL